MAKTAAARYSQLERLRQPFLSRARSAAKLTIPTLLPPEGHNGDASLPTPFQGIGARGVNNLASKLLLALFPPNSPIFRLLIDDFTIEELTKQEGMKALVEEALGKVERAVMTEIEGAAIRVTAFEALKQLIVAGNVLLYLPPEGGMRAYRLDRFVVKRDPMGNILEHITKETVAPDTLPKEFVAKLGPNAKQKFNNAMSADKTLDLYTHVKLVNGMWRIYQEVEGVKVPGTEGTYPKGKSAWIPLRFTKIDGEDYGRGYVEEYYGDLKSLETLTKAIVEGSAAAAKILILVNPNGSTNKKVIAEAPNGAVRSGDAKDVTFLQLDKYADFRIAKETMSEISQRLAMAFLLNTAIQRAGERVTAEEIRYMAGELEDALGGVYSILSQEFQLPLVSRIMFSLERTRKLPPLPSGVVKPAITTGLEALGRGHDQMKLDSLLQRLAPLGPEVLAEYLNVGDYIKRSATAIGIEATGLVRSDEEVQQMRQQKQLQQMIQQFVPEMAGAVRDQLKPEAQG
ncbi:portal protein [Rhizobium sp. NFACC06-2]|uniref:portal protein n=1 Tax=Rhizobium sp. NFACC06-2 TaxID=1566264 RepID=UPI0008766A05|nr:portal protein [Rhizobium sp. NFACC06-2]SCY04814.1 Bacteriophage head to tail connecting protein [Rhizobium sp. NFACC06-2]